jgi:hypothetical protein
LDSDEEDDDDEVDREAGAPDGEYEKQGDDPDDGEDSDDDDSDSEEEDGMQGGKVRGELYEEMKAEKSQSKKRKPPPKKTAAKKKRTEMHETDDGAVNLGLGDESAADRARRRTEEMNMPLAKRFALQKNDASKPQVRMAGGSKEATFIPRDTQRKMEAEAKKKEASNEERGKRSRRGVKDLGFKTPFRHLDK